MKYQLAQLNVAKFRLPSEHPDNDGFHNYIDRINEIAESQPGFIWRLVGEGNDATDIQAFDDPDMIVNMSLWENLDTLFEFVYRNQEHKNIMRKRKDWFDKMEFHLVLWWVKEGHIPSLHEAKQKLKLIQEKGASEHAFSFARPFPAPTY